MKHKRLLVLGVLLTLAASAFGFAACDSGAGDGGDHGDHGDHGVTPPPAHEHVMQYVPAVEATCLEEGFIEYWLCTDCGKYFSDEEGEREISYESTVIPATGHVWGNWQARTPATCAAEGENFRRCKNCGEEETESIAKQPHSMQYSAYVPSSCTETGMSEYYFCASCGGYFLDEAGTQPTSYENLFLAKRNHSWSGYGEWAPTCIHNGNKAYFYCDVCEKYFWDKECTQETTWDEIVIPAKGHSMTHHAAVPVTCTQNGNVEYWDCSVCGKMFSDGEGETELFETVIWATGHRNMEYVPSEPATCTEEGVKEHYHCADCGRNYSDGGGYNELFSISIAPLAHKNMYHNPAREATCTESGNIEFWSCRDCNKLFYDENGTEEITDRSYYFPAKGHTYSEAWSSDEMYHWREATCGCDVVADHDKHLCKNRVCTECAKAFDYTYGMDYMLIDGGTAYKFTSFWNATDEDIIIPSEFNGLPVTQIDSWAFGRENSIKSIIVPDSVQKIAERSFEGCVQLESLTLPFIGEQKDSAEPARLKDLFGPLTGWESPASLKKITITGDKIRENALRDCTFIETVVLTNPGLSSIGDSAFHGCTSLKNVVLPDNLSSVGVGIFYGCSALRSITLPAKLLNIGGSMFSSCSALEELVVPDSVETIGSGAFFNCSQLKKITIGSGVKKIEDQVFENCKLDGVYIKDIAAWCAIDFGSRPVSVSQGRLYLNGELLTELIVPDGVTQISPDAFNSCYFIERAVISDDVISIGEYAFAHCTDLKEIAIGNGVETIGANAFYGCFDLMHATVGKNLQSIGDSAFKDCYKLTEIYNKSALDIKPSDSGNGGIAENAKNVYTQEGGSHFTLTDDGFLFCRDSVLGKNYLVNYSGTETTLELPRFFTGYDGVVYNEYNIADHAFYRCAQLVKVTVPSIVAEIGEYAFEECSSLEQIELFYGLKSIGQGAFKNCSSLTGILIPEDITTIGPRTFSGCRSLENVTLSYGLERIEYEAFSGCVSLKKIVLPDSLTHLVAYAFSGCSALKDITWSKNLQYVGQYTFSRCVALENVTLPDGVEWVDAWAFAHCEALKTVFLPDSIQIISENVFTESNSLVNIFYGGTKQQWEEVSVAGWNEVIETCLYFYSEEPPAESGNFWHYADDGVTPVVWSKEII